jgi:hypothetical protein
MFRVLQGLEDVFHLFNSLFSLLILFNCSKECRWLELEESLQSHVLTTGCPVVWHLL